MKPSELPRLFFMRQEKWKSLNHVRLFAVPRTVACHAPLSVEFSRPVYWSDQPFPSPGDLPDSGIRPRSPTLQANSLLSGSLRKPKNIGVGSLSLLQQFFLTHDSNQGFLHCRWILYQLSYQESPTNTKQKLIRILVKLQSDDVYTVYKLVNVYLWLTYLVPSSHWWSLGFIAGRQKLRRWIASNHLKLCFEFLIHILFFSFPLKGRDYCSEEEDIT